MAYDFPNSPTVGQAYSGYVWDGEKWQAQGTTMQSAVRYDLSQGLTANQTAQARANIWVTKKNYVINGGMQISQENGTTSASINGAIYYPADMYACYSSTGGSLSAARLISPSIAGGNFIYVSVGTADTSVGATDQVQISQQLEGSRVADLRFGTANAKTVTLQFGVNAPAGTYSVVLANAANNRSYVAEYVISAGEALTNVYKSVTIPGDTTGTWATDNTIGITVRWGLMCGTNYQQAAGSWAGSTNIIGSPNQFNLAGTVGNTFYLFDVSLTEGNVAPPFQLPDYASELALCQRYFYNGIPSVKGGAVTASLGQRLSARHPVPMRATPTLLMTAAVVAWDVSATPTVTSIVNNGTTTTVLEFEINTPAVLTPGRPVTLLQGSGGNINVNARL